MNYRTIQKTISIFTLTCILIFAISNLNFPSSINIQNSAQAQFGYPWGEDNSNHEDIDSQFSDLESRARAVLNIIGRNTDISSRDFSSAYDIAYDLFSLAKRSESIGDDVIKEESINYSLSILETLERKYITKLSSLFVFAHRESELESRTSIRWRGSSTTEEQVRQDIQILELLQQVYVFKGQQNSGVGNRVNNLRDSNPLALALTHSEYTRTFAIDFQLINSYYELMKEVFQSMKRDGHIDNHREDAVRLSRASDIFSQIRLPSIEDIRRIARDEDATLVLYSLISNEDISLPKQLYIWVVEPSGKISFVNQSAVEDVQGSIRDFASLRQSNCESSYTDLSDNCRSAYVALADEGMRIVRGSLGVADYNTEAQGQVQEQAQNLNGLYQLLITPIEDLLPRNDEAKVIFVPDSSLNFIPFAALKNPHNQKYLIEEHPIVTVPNIRTLALSAIRREELGAHQGRKTALIVGDPKPMPDSSLIALPGAAKEASDIANLLDDEGFRVAKYIGETATERRVTDRMQDDATVIHLATHGIINTNNGSSNSYGGGFDSYGSSVNSAEASGSIALSGEYLNASEIFNITLPNTELVVLSACNTGVGELVPGGVVGLPFSFNAAGASSVLMSLWNVPDAPTAELMTKFYEYWLDRRNNKAQALRAAMMEMIQKYPDPKDWAAFTLVGSAE